MNSQGLSSPAARPDRRGVPMPLWLQGVLELGSVAVVSYLLVLLTVLMVWLADGFDTLGLTGGFVLSGHVWLLAHLTPLQVALDPGAIAPGRVGIMIGGPAPADTCGSALAVARDGQPGPAPTTPEPPARPARPADLLRGLLR